MPRRALWLLLAAAALPATPLLAQYQTSPPPSDIVVPPVDLPDPIVTQPPVTQPPLAQPPVIQTTQPPSATTRSTAAPTTPQPRTTTRTARPAPARATARPRAQAPVRTAAPTAQAPAPVAAPTAPAAETAAPAPAAAQPPLALPVPQEETPASGPSIWLWAVGGALLLLAAFALFQMRRHRGRTEAHEEYYDEAPVAVVPERESFIEPAPLAAVPVAAAASPYQETVSTPMGDVVEPEEFAPATGEAIAVPEEAVVAKGDQADAEALSAASVAPDGRPWLEFLMRPIRAGTSKDSAVVEFELTVGNTGSVPARDVRISTFMFAAGAAGESEMERMLIDPPADAVTRVDIPAGEAQRLETSMALSRDAMDRESVLPVVVADARYLLPDGSEGRTRASFEVGLPSGEGLDPFPTDRASGLFEGVEARLHGEPERV